MSVPQEGGYMKVVRDPRVGSTERLERRKQDEEVRGQRNLMREKRTSQGARQRDEGEVPEGTEHFQGTSGLLGSPELGLGTEWRLKAQRRREASKIKIEPAKPGASLPPPSETK